MALEMRGNTVQNWNTSMVLTNSGANTSNVTAVYHSAHDSFGPGAVVLSPNGVKTDYQIDESQTTNIQRQGQ